MSVNWRNIGLFAAVAVMVLIVGFVQSWNVALGLVNMGLVSAIMALGVNMQWGYAGLFNVGIMGFVALGGLAVVITSSSPVGPAWDAGGFRILFSLAYAIGLLTAAIVTYQKMKPGRLRALVMTALLVVGFFAYRAMFDPGVEAVEAIDPAATGFLGGLGLPVLVAWPVGGLLAALAAWAIGKTALGLRSDYLAIATLGISEIIIAVMKNEDPRFLDFAANIGMNPVTASSITVKLAYAGLFLTVLIVLIWMSESALKSPWGRMMRAIRDNEVAAGAMGKDVTRRHLQIFILGSAVVGIAGAMMTTLDGQLTPASYQPLRYTFLVWVMVIVGGSGNNWGAVLGGFIIWFFWNEVEPIAYWSISHLTSFMSDDSPLKLHLLHSTAHLKMFTMGLIMLLVLRFSPRGLIP
ncbi:MAG: branched-chain amino acid ABC transporter permease, partial [Maritimibacter sp.]